MGELKSTHTYREIMECLIVIEEKRMMRDKYEIALARIGHEIHLLRATMTVMPEIEGTKEREPFPYKPMNEWFSPKLGESEIELRDKPKKPVLTPQEKQERKLRKQRLRMKKIKEREDALKLNLSIWFAAASRGAKIKQDKK